MTPSQPSPQEPSSAHSRANDRVHSDKRAASPEIRKVRGRLALLRARVRSIIATVAASRWIVAAVAALALFFVADWMLDLPLQVRRFVRSGILTRPESWGTVFWIVALAVMLFLAVALTRGGKRIAPFFAFFVGGIVGLLAWFGYRQLAPLTVPLKDEHLALGVESRYGELKDQLTSALDFDRELHRSTPTHQTTLQRPDAAGSRGESRELMEAVVRETHERAKKVRFARAANAAPARKWTTAALLALVGAGLAAATIPATKLWAQRSLLLQDIEWPRDTTMIAVDVRTSASEDEGVKGNAASGDSKDPSPRNASDTGIGTSDENRAEASREGVLVTPRDPDKPFLVTVGRPLTVYALAQGDVPDDAYLLDYVDGKQPLSRRMFKVAGRDDLFAFEFRDVRRPFTFVLRGGDDVDSRPEYSVDISIPPRIRSISTTVTYPSYLNREPSVHEQGSVRVPQGSTIDVTFVPDVPLASAHALIGHKRMNVTQASSTALPSGVDGTPYKFSMEAKSTFRYQLALVTPDGKRNESAADSFEVRVQEDRAPRVDWIYPRGLQERTENGRLPLLIRAKDDYGIASLVLEMRSSSDVIQRVSVLGGSVSSDSESDDSNGERSNDKTLANVVMENAKIEGVAGAERVLAYLPIDLSSVRDPEGNPFSPPSRVSLRIVAKDTKGQTREGEWNAVDVASSLLIERGLSISRASVRSQLVALRREQAARRDDVAEVLAAIPKGREVESPQAMSDRSETLRSVRFRQGRIVQDARRATRGMTRIFNSFIYNRLGATNPNERILAIFNRFHGETFGVSPTTRRQAGSSDRVAESSSNPTQPSTERRSASGALGDPVFPYRLYDEVIEAWRAKLIYDKGLIERMLTVLLDSVHIAARLAPKVHTLAIDTAGATAKRTSAADASKANKREDGEQPPADITNTPTVRKQVQQLLAAQDEHLASIDRLLESMSSWQSLSELTMLVRGIAEEQESLRDRMESFDGSSNDDASKER